MFPLWYGDGKLKNLYYQTFSLFGMVGLFFSFMYMLRGTFVILYNVVSNMSNGVSFGSITPTSSNFDQLGILHHFFPTESHGFNNTINS